MPPRLLLLLLLLLGVAAVHAAELKLQLDADQPVTVTLADGATRELTAAEFEALAKERAEENAKLQSQDDAAAAEWQRQGLDEIEAQDPQFALLIDLARRAFRDIQRHGYAQGYALAGFSEQEEAHKAADYYVELVLRAKKDPSSGVPTKTGTGTRKLEKEGEETPLSYEVQLLLDAEKHFSVVAAWELSEKEPPRGQRRKRVMRLSIQPTAALLEREAKRERGKSAVATWLLAGGVAMVAAGVLVMYNTRNPIPAPKPRRRSSDIWELVDENDKPIKLDKAEQPTTTDKSDKKND
ncbi:hypothetical protein PHYPSEUDO_010610 [Phytophthora pseudosyringae]|uniref:RxLR effector protein n=1 Tax=Phytophthora pseudosyringae TaxID=221518 RepID=A0A8T1VD32_9STRA|nr:hypothetical protein PHYPSEUDO_010610 [Phytophthora pseudosyringae]